MTDKDYCQHYSNNLPKGYGDRCCIRESWGEDDKCIWHSNSNSKPINKLEDSLRKEKASNGDCVLVNVILFDQDLFRLNISSCVFISPIFNGVDLSSRDISDLKIVDGNLFQCDFTNSNINNIMFKETKLKKTWFDNANISYLHLRDCYLSLSSFDQTKIDEIKSQGGKWVNVNFSALISSGKITGKEIIKHSKFSGRYTDIIFKSDKIISSYFSEGSFAECEFRNTNLNKCTGFRTKFSGINFIESDVINCTFKQSDFPKYLDFKGSKLEKNIFRNNIINNVSIEKGKILDIIFASVENPIHKISMSAVEKANNIKLNVGENTNISIADSKITRLKISDGDIDRLHLLECDLIKSNLSGVVPSFIEWNSVVIKQSEAKRFIFPSESNCEFSDIRIVQSDWSTSVFNFHDLTPFEIEDTQLIACIFNNIKTDIGTSFKGSNLTMAVFNEADLFHTDFTESTLFASDFTGSIFDKTDIRDAKLLFARLTDADLRNVRINENTEFGDMQIYEYEADAIVDKSNIEKRIKNSGRDYVSKSINSVSRGFKRFINSSLIGISQHMRELTTGFQPIDRIIYHSSKDIERLGLNKEYSEKDSEALTDSIHVYRSLQRSCRENAVPNKARKFLIRERHCRRKRALSDRKRIKWLRAAFMRRFANYAEGYTSILLWSGVIIIGSAILYPSVGGVGLTANEGQIYAFNSKLDSSIFNGLPNNIKIFLVSLYFSLVTFTTLGYGDIQPIGAASKAIAGIESLFGVILMAVLVFVLGRRATW